MGWVSEKDNAGKYRMFENCFFARVPSPQRTVYCTVLDLVPLRTTHHPIDQDDVDGLIRN